MSYKKLNSSLEEISIDRLLRFNYRTTKYKKNIIEKEKFYSNSLKIKSLFNILSGYAFSSKDYTEDGIFIVRIGDLNSYNLNYDNMVKVPFEYYVSKKFSNYIVKKEDILVSLTGDGNLKCLYFDDDEKLLLNQRVAILRAKKNINTKFFYWLLNSDFVKEQFAYYSNGKSQLNISPFDLANIRLPLLDEKKQKEFMEKITPEIEKINKISLNKKKLCYLINDVFAEKFNYDKNLINELRKGMTYGTQSSTNRKLNTFYNNFSNITDNKLRLSARANAPIVHSIYEIINKFGTINLKDVVYENIHRGKSPEYDKNGSIPVIKTAHVTNNGISAEYEEFVNNDFYDKKVDSQLKNGDILLASTGKPSIGKIDIFEGDYKAIPDGHITIIRIDKNKYNRNFFVYFIRSVLGYMQIEKDYVGCTNQIELYPEEIGKIKLPNISLSEQEEIAKEIDEKINEQNEIENMINNEQEKIEKILLETLNDQNISKN